MISSLLSELSGGAIPASEQAGMPNANTKASTNQNLEASMTQPPGLHNPSGDNS